MSAMTADEIRRRRLARGWSRKRLQQELGTTIYAAERFERSGPAGRDEILLVLSVLGRCGEEESPHGEGCALRECSCECHLAGGADDEISTEFWRGLRANDQCCIVGPKGNRSRLQYRFVRYFRNPAQEYVELVGPRGETRTVRPTDVRDARGRELTGAPIG